MIDATTGEYIAAEPITITLSTPLIRRLYGKATEMAEKYKGTSGYQAGSIEPIHIDALNCTPEREAMPFVVGLLGETAFYQYMKQQRGFNFPTPDITKYVTSDPGYDFDYLGTKYDVKTSVRGPNADTLVKANGGSVNFDTLVSAYHALNTNDVVLRGWCSAKRVLRMPQWKSSKGDWYNYEVHEWALSDMRTLLTR